MKNFYLSRYQKRFALILFCALAFTYFTSNAQYCNTGLGGAGCGTDQITGVEIIGTSLVNLNNPCTGTFSNTLTVFPSSGNTTANLIQGVTYNISITTGANNIISLWIDYNQNSTFSAAEWTQVCTTSTPGGTTTIAITIPTTSLLGTTGLRIRSRAVNNTNGATNACTNFGSGETEDYTIQIVSATPCAGTPVAGKATAAAAVCPNVSFNLGLTGSTQAGGLTYQWQSSPDTIVWTSISAATSISYTTSQTTNTYYRCIVACSGAADTSNFTLVSTNSFVNCYCTSAATNTFDDDIGNVTFGSINNGIATPALNNPTSINTYTDFTSLAPAAFLQGLNYPISVTQINEDVFYVCYLTVYIDYNHDGVFDINSELVFDGETDASSTGNVLNGTVTIPLNSLPGITRMRLVLQEGGSITQPSCGTYGYGETEDYLVNIQAATLCVAPPAAGTATSSVTKICPSINFNLNLTGSSVASGLSYQWQRSTNNVSFSNISGASTINYSASITSNTYFRCLVTCSSVTDSSSSVLVSVNNFTTCFCTSAANSAFDDDIGNVSIGSLNNGVGTPALNNITSVNTYTDFTNLPATTLFKGLSYPISVTQINEDTYYQCYLTAYIDYNQDGIFDITSELIFDGQTSAGVGNNVLTGNVSIPLTALNGQTLMRFVLRENGSVTQSPCGGYGYGETEDYLVTILLAAPCIAPASAGTTLASDSSVCPNTNFNLGLAGNAQALGLSYQWESSPDTINWTSISGATTLNYQTSQTSATYYRCNVFCTGVSSFSTSLFVDLNSFVSCYCASGATSGTGADIGSVKIGQFSNGSASPITNNPLAVKSYTDYTYLGAINIIKNLYYPLTVMQISTATIQASRIAAFIDYDHDGIFDPSAEIAYGGQTQNGAAGNTVFDSINVPSTALGGLTRMRIVLVQGNTNPDPCNTYFTGETEDYLLNILNDSPCKLPFTVGITQSNVPLVCSEEIFSLTLPALPPDTGFSFQWQSSFDATLWQNISGATQQFHATSEKFPTYYRCIVACSAGTDSISSTPVFVNKKPLSQCNYCNTLINGNCIGNYYIDSLAIGATTLNNANTGCAANAGFAFSKYPANGNTTTLLGAGNYYDIFVKTAGRCNISAWIDYDQSGTFDAQEWIQISTATDSAVTATIPLVLPDSVKLGLTGLRIRSRKAGNLNLGNDACSTYGSGETEDYYVTIVSAISTGKELSIDKNIKIYPNPTSGVVSIEYRSDDTKSLKIRVMNMEGQEIFTQTTDNFKGLYSHKLDMAAYSKGIYMVQFITDKKSSIKKIVLH